MQTAKNVVTNIIPTTQVTATNGTLAWVEALYEAGAILVEPDGHLAVQPEVREAIRAMHAILAGGQVTVEITNDGGGKCDELERRFDHAMEEASSALVNRNANSKAEPPLAP